MTPIENLDNDYELKNEEKNYVKEILDTKWVKELFAKEQKNLQSKIIRNFHTENYSNFEINKQFENEKNSMKNIINNDPNMKTKYETALAKNQKKWGFSEGILLLQTIAITCVEKINGKESVTNKLSSWNGLSFKSQAMDGILWPNTFYVLASIAKEKKISFNGSVDKPLLEAMIGICGETTPPQKEPIETPKQQPTKETQPQISTVKQTTVTIPGNAIMTATNKIEKLSKEEIEKQIETLQNEPIDPKKQPNEYKTRNEKISTLQEEKEAKMTAEEIQKEIQTITSQIKDLESKKTKENEFFINNKINFLLADKNHLEKLLQEKQSVQEEITF